MSAGMMQAMSVTLGVFGVVAIGLMVAAFLSKIVKRVFSKLIYRKRFSSYSGPPGRGCWRCSLPRA